VNLKKAHTANSSYKNIGRQCGLPKFASRSTFLLGGTEIAPKALHFIAANRCG